MVSTVVQRPVCYPLELHRPRGVNVFCWTASGQQVKDLETRRLMGSIRGVRKGFRASAAAVTTALLLVADMVDNVKSSCSQRTGVSRTIRVTKVAIECVCAENCVCEVDNGS